MVSVGTVLASRPMAQAEGFVFEARQSGEVVVRHHGRIASTLRGGRAEAFLARVAELDHDQQQALMARVTGNYKRGNERRLHT